MRGFLLTKDDYRLTGYVNQINYVVTGLQIEFTNDFGDRYFIYPSYVKGFGYTRDGETFRYVSRYYEGRWFFLREMVKERQLSFFRVPDGRQRYVDDSLLALLADPIPQYWLQIKGQEILAIQRGGFKRRLRDYLEPTAPALAAKIGSKGYRYRNMEEIITAYLKTYRRSKRRL
jgi:hypothetical protein